MVIGTIILVAFYLFLFVGFAALFLSLEFKTIKHGGRSWGFIHRIYIRHDLNRFNW